jgi:hypothetical protein
MPRRLAAVLRAAPVVLTLLATASFAHAKDPAPSEAERIAALEKSLTNSALVGHYTTTGEQETPAEERYELGKVKHLGKGLWLIEARIKYRDRDLAIPLTLPIHWAGDTPVITVNDIPFPGLGTYSARVMIYRDHYAGFWTGNDHGGHLFGVVEHEDKKGENKDDAATK